MDERIAYCLDAELHFAQAKFPGNDDTLIAFVEEVGELANALLEHKRGNAPASSVFAEAVQVAVMAIRLAMEGDSAFPYRFEHRHYQEFDTNKLLKKAAPPLPRYVSETDHDAQRYRYARDNGLIGCPNCITPWKCNGPHIIGGPDLDAAVDAALAAAEKGV